VLVTQLSEPHCGMLGQRNWRRNSCRSSTATGNLEMCLKFEFQTEISNTITNITHMRWQVQA
jgi:hypothetical protein